MSVNKSKIILVVSAILFLVLAVLFIHRQAYFKKDDEGIIYTDNVKEIVLDNVTKQSEEDIEDIKIWNDELLRKLEIAKLEEAKQILSHKLLLAEIKIKRLEKEKLSLSKFLEEARAEIKGLEIQIGSI